MNYQRQNHRLLFHFAGAIVLPVILFAGCAARKVESLRICPGKKSIAESLFSLSSNSEGAASLKANGRCLAQIYVDGKLHKEDFAIKLWINPPVELYLQGDVAFDPKGIVIGSNEDEFWLAMKPKEIGNSYYWGKWSEQDGFGKLKIAPSLLLEALGLSEISDEGTLSLSNEGSFDILTKYNEQGAKSKKIYVDCCDYRVRKIEYLDANGKAVIVTEPDKYKKVSEGFFVPAIIKIINRAHDGTEESLKISLNSIKQQDFSAKLRKALFSRPEPRSFRHIFRIIDGKMVEQQQ